MKRLLLIACVLSCTLLSQAKDWTQYVNPLMVPSLLLSYQQVILIRLLPSLGYELLDSTDRQNGRRMAIYLYRQQNPRVQTDTPAQSVDQ